MSEKTNIAWADSSANPVIGCTPCSPGCASCYARVDTPARVLRHRGIETWGPKAQRYAVKGFEKQMLSFNRRPWMLYDGVHRRRVFVGSNCDILDPAWPIETLAHTLDVIRRCPDIVTILCTKRPELFKERLVTAGNRAWTIACDASRQTTHVAPESPVSEWIGQWLDGNPPTNLWILTSVENQDYIHRLDALRKIPAAVRGVSFEPLLGPITVPDWTGIGWAIIGGESGPKARPCDIEWIRSLKDQAQSAGVPVFIKQIQVNGKLIKDATDFPAALRVRQFPTP